MKVFLLEDRPENVRLIRAMLEGLGCRVVVATTIKQGLLLSRGPYDAAFLDHDLPYDDNDESGVGDVYAGTEVAKELLKKDFSLPIVAISAVESNNEHLESVGAFLSNRKDTLDQDRMKELLSACRNWRHTVSTLLR